jgi:dienelactone hydrolase
MKQKRITGKADIVRSFIAALLLTPLAMAHAAEIVDPLAPYLDGKAPEILREVPSVEMPPERVAVRRVVFRSRDDSEIFAVVARPKTPGVHPGMLVLHGGGGSAEVDKALAWAARGYVAVAPDLPGIAEPKKLTLSKGKWSSLKYGEGRWVATPDASASVICDAVLAAMKSLYLLRAQPDVDRARIGVVGCSWGGYMTTMVCGLAGDEVRAGFAVWGCGFYDLTAQLHGPKSTLGRMPQDERDRWLRHLDAGRRAPGMKAAFFIAGATNDFFYWPRAVQATLDAIPGEKNHLYAPNSNHKAPVPGGSVFERKTVTPFTPTPFQPYPTPSGNRANWLAMEVPFFDYYLKHVGQPLPKVSVEKGGDPLLARFGVTAPRPLASVQVYWAKANPDVMKRQWLALPATKIGENRYEAKLPAEAADWFALASDDRPATVSSDLIALRRSLKASPASACRP